MVLFYHAKYVGEVSWPHYAPSCKTLTKLSKSKKGHNLPKKQVRGMGPVSIMLIYHPEKVCEVLWPYYEQLQRYVPSCKT